MMIFRPLIIIILLVVSILFVLQNQQPTALVLFGTKTLQLPLAAWVLIFIGAGIFTSLFLQFLYKSFGTTTERNRGNIPSPDPVAPPRRAVKEVFGQKNQEPSDFRKYSETPPSQFEPKINTEWDKDNKDKEWDIETPPSRPTLIQEEVREPNLYQEPSTNFEVQQQPKTTSRQGSVYSYSYRDAKQPERNSSDGVYDADYRVITSGGRENISPPQDEEEEDWV